MKIRPTPDLYSIPGKTEKVRYIGPGWTKDLAWQLKDQDIETQTSLTIDISQIDFITLFEWAGVIALLERQLNNSTYLREIMIDAKGENIHRFIPPHDFIRQTKGEEIPFTSTEIKESKRIYKILGFIESLGGCSVLRHPVNFFETYPAHD